MKSENCTLWHQWYSLRRKRRNPVEIRSGCANNGYQVSTLRVTSSDSVVHWRPRETLRSSHRSEVPATRRSSSPPWASAGQSSSPATARARPRSRPACAPPPALIRQASSGWRACRETRDGTVSRSCGYAWRRGAGAESRSSSPHRPGAVPRAGCSWWDP